MALFYEWETEDKLYTTALRLQNLIVHDSLQGCNYSWRKYQIMNIKNLFVKLWVNETTVYKNRALFKMENTDKLKTTAFAD